MAIIGDLCELQGEVKFQWKIKNFSSLLQERNIFCNSSTFYFADASWSIKLYPCGDTEKESQDCIGMYLMKRSFGSPIALNYTFSLKTVDGGENKTLDFTFVFARKDSGFGTPHFISKSVLEKNKSELIPSDVLTIICTLKHSEPKYASGSFFNRLENVSNNLKEIYIKAKRTDLLLKLNGGNLRAHRLILETRSPVFCAMFSHDTKENQTGEVSVNDVDKGTMESLLILMYSGQSALFESLTIENAMSIYAAADKYDVKDAKDTCLKFITLNLSVEWVCDVLKFADLYQELEIGRRARAFFKENAKLIFETENWKSFAKENHDNSVELLSSLVKTLLPN